LLLAPVGGSTSDHTLKSNSNKVQKPLAILCSRWRVSLQPLAEVQILFKTCRNNKNCYSLPLEGLPPTTRLSPVQFITCRNNKNCYSFSSEGLPPTSRLGPTPIKYRSLSLFYILVGGSPYNHSIRSSSKVPIQACWPIVDLVGGSHSNHALKSKFCSKYAETIKTVTRARWRISLQPHDEVQILVKVCRTN
jgi:hypothetical protein